MKRVTKKLMSLALSTAMVFSCFAASAVQSSAAVIRYGDVDGNDKINSADALAVLKHSVGIFELDSDKQLRADTNGDKRINSADALLILKYSIGFIKSFPVEESGVKTADEILKMYSDAVAKSREEKPSYTFEATTATKDVDVSISGITATLLLGSTKAQKEADMEAEMTTSQHYRQIIKQGSDKSLNNLPSECKLEDAGALKSISCKQSDAGNYIVNITFKDETNPKADTSPLVKALGVSDYDELKKACEESNSTEEFSLTFKSFEVKYVNSSILCEINPTTGEFVTLTWQTQTLVNMKTSVVDGFNIDISMTMDILSDYSNFGY